MAGMQFVANGNSIAARDLVLGVFQQQQWSVSMKNEWEAKAEHGSKAASFFGGAFAGKGGRHVIINISVSSDPQGKTFIKLIEGASGFSGGLIGVSQAKEVYQTMYNNVGMALQSAGIFVSNSAI